MKFYGNNKAILLWFDYQRFMILVAKNVRKSVIFFALGVAGLEKSRTFALPFEKRVADKAESS